MKLLASPGSAPIFLILSSGSLSLPPPKRPLIASLMAFPPILVHPQPATSQGYPDWFQRTRWPWTTMLSIMRAKDAISRIRRRMCPHTVPRGAVKGLAWPSRHGPEIATVPRPDRSALATWHDGLAGARVLNG